MREIKFRGYCTSDKKMYSPVYFDNLEVWWWEPEKDEIEILGDISPNGLLYQVILMQLTGLKDILDPPKEIYDGDILKPEKGSLKRVFFKNGGFAFSNKSKRSKAHPLFSQLIYQRKFEVIGNIHENPELL